MNGGKKRQTNRLSGEVQVLPVEQQEAMPGEQALEQIMLGPLTTPDTPACHMQRKANSPEGKAHVLTVISRMSQ